MTASDIAEGRRLLEAATPPPWTVDRYGLIREGADGVAHAKVYRGFSDDPRPAADAAAIAFFLNHAKDLLDTAGLLDAAEKRRWVPCSERMPTNEGLVHVSHVTGLVTFCRWDDELRVWENDFSTYPECEITHWMPLPELPEDTTHA